MVCVMAGMVWEKKQDTIYRKIPKKSFTQENHYSFQRNSSASSLLFTHIHIIQCHEFNFHFLWNFHILQNFWKLRYKEQLGNTNKVSYTLVIKMEMEGYSQDKVLECDSKEHGFPLVMHRWKKNVVILSVDQNESSVRLRICLLVRHLGFRERHTFRGDLTDWLPSLSLYILDIYIHIN